MYRNLLNVINVNKVNNTHCYPAIWDTPVEKCILIMTCILMPATVGFGIFLILIL